MSPSSRRHILVGKYHRLPLTYKDALAPFIREKVFELCVRPVTLQKLAATPPALLAGARNIQTGGLTSSTVGDANYEVTRLLAAEIDLNVPTIALLRHLHNYGFTRRPRVDNTVCDLSDRVRAIGVAAEEVLRFEAQRTGIRHVSIPPVALKVLRNARTIDQLPYAILEMRQKFRPLREKMRSLGEILADPTLETADYFRLVRRWEEEWQTATRSAVTVTLGLGRTSGVLLAHGAEIATAMEEQHYVGAALSVFRLFRDSRHILAQRLFRPVHYSVRNYIQGGHRQMVKAVGPLFEMDMRAAHQQMSFVATTASSCWREALKVQQDRRIALAAPEPKPLLSPTAPRRL